MKYRDPTIFPNDENGDVLWRMNLSGDNLNKPREIDFWAIFKSRESALQFAIAFLQNKEKVSFSSNQNIAFPWQAGVHPVLRVSHQIISEFERKIDVEAQALGGKTDGWGCEQQA